MSVTSQEELLLRKKWDEEFQAKLKHENELLEEKKKLNLVPNRNSYLLIIILVALIVVSAIVLLEIFSTKDNTITIAGVIAFGTAFMLQLIQLLKSEELKIEQKEAALAAKETYHLFNSRMSDALESAARAAYGEGRKAGREDAEARTDKLAGQVIPVVEPLVSE